MGQAWSLSQGRFRVLDAICPLRDTCQATGTCADLAASVACLPALLREAHGAELQAACRTEMHGPGCSRRMVSWWGFCALAGANASASRARPCGTRSAPCPAHHDGPERPVSLGRIRRVPCPLAGDHPGPHSVAVAQAQKLLGLGIAESCRAATGGACSTASAALPGDAPDSALFETGSTVADGPSPASARGREQSGPASQT